MKKLLTLLLVFILINSSVIKSAQIFGLEHNDNGKESKEEKENKESSEKEELAIFSATDKYIDKVLEKWIPEKTKKKFQQEQLLRTIRMGYSHWKKNNCVLDEQVLKKIKANLSKYEAPMLAGDIRENILSYLQDWRSIKFNTKDVITCIFPMSDGRFLTGNSQGSVELWDFNGKCEEILSLQKEFKVISPFVIDDILVKDEEAIISSFGRLFFINLNTKTKSKESIIVSKNWESNFLCNLNKNLIGSYSSENKILKIWNITGKNVYNGTFENYVTAVFYHPIKNILVVATGHYSEPKKIYIYKIIDDPLNFQLITAKTIESQVEPNWKIAIDNNTLITLHDDEISFYNLDTLLKENYTKDVGIEVLDFCLIGNNQIALVGGPPSTDADDGNDMVSMNTPSTFIILDYLSNKLINDFKQGLDTYYPYLNSICYLGKQKIVISDRANEKLELITKTSSLYDSNNMYNLYYMFKSYQLVNKYRKLLNVLYKVESNSYLAKCLLVLCMKLR